MSFAVTGITRAAIRTSVGQQDFRDPNMKVIPNAAFFILSGALVNGSVADGALFGIGAATGLSDQWSSCGGAVNGVIASSQTRKSRVDTNNCILIMEPSPPATITGLADFVTFLSDVGAGAGIRVDWSVASSIAYLITVILFRVDNALALTYAGGTQDVPTAHAVGFEPTLLLGFFNNVSPAFATQSNFGFSVGFASNQFGIIDQAENANFFQSGITPAASGGQIRKDGIVAAVSASGIEANRNEITGFSSAGFTTTHRTATTTSLVGVLALDCGDSRVWVGTVNSPTVAGSVSESGPGFKPDIGVMYTSNMEALNTEYLDNRAGSLSVSVFNKFSELTTVLSNEDGVGTTNTKSISIANAVYQINDDSTLQFQASFTEFTQTGWILNYSNVIATQKVWFAFAIEAESEAQPPSVGRELTPLRARVDLVNTSGDVVAIFEDFRSLSFNLETSSKGDYQMTLSGFDDRINLFEPDFLVRVWLQELQQDIDWTNVFNGFHKTFIRGMSAGGQRTFISFGPSLEEIIAKAYVLYPGGLSTRARKSGVASTVMYSYVIQNSGVDALLASGRDIDHVNPITNSPDLVLGPTWTGIRARKNLLTVLRDIRDYAIQQNDQVDFKVNYLGGYTFEFEVFDGVDRTVVGVSALSDGLNGAGNVPVVFGPNYRNIQRFTRSESRFNEANVMVGLGKAKDDNTQIAVATDTLSIAASPIAQRESVVSATSEDSVADVLVRANSRLQEKLADDRFSFEPSRGAAQLLWRDYFPSDFITGEDEDGTRFNKQVIGVRVNIAPVEGGDQVMRTNINFSNK